MNDDSVIETVDFTEFEALFQVKRFKKKEKSANKDDETGTYTCYNDFSYLDFYHNNYYHLYHLDQAKPAERLCLIEDRRGRNLGKF